ncbi:amidase [Psychrobacter sp. GP33]|uniref:amidase n=1 Tax=Psychrobacter sp. GP33 TaxID=2758709 RepID=UPI0021755351|nr:amidase [Psychrobacter sp. GP33]
MAMFKEYTHYDALGLAELVKSKQVSAKELLDAAIHQANKINPTLNAIIHRFDERAYLAAQQGLPQGAFTGVPYLLKDLSFYFADEPLTMGSRSIHIVPSQDSEIVKRMKATGLNTFGKTNTPEFGLIITTEPKAHGATQNPFKKGYSSGGSSGGSAAAVASGIVPMAGAGDGGGSIRFPAAWCGEFGFKPSRGRNPIGPSFGEGWDGAIADHVISRSVRDSAAMLDATSGSEVGAPYVIAPPEGTFLQAAMRAPRRLTIALHQQPLVADTLVDKEVLAVLERTAAQLEAMGHRVIPAEPAINIDKFWHDFMVVICAHTAFTIDNIERCFGTAHISNLEPQTYNMALLGRSLSAVDLVHAKQGWHDSQYQTGKLLEQYDMILCPTIPTPAVKHGVLPPSYLDELLMRSAGVVNKGFSIGKYAFSSGLIEQLSHPVFSKMAFTLLGNVTGLPAMSVPVGMSKKGLPIGMQLIGRMNDETTLFSVAGEMERAGMFTKPAFS